MRNGALVLVALAALVGAGCSDDPPAGATSGTSGSAGTSGTGGNAGTAGVSGTAGTAGASGSSGLAGTAGTGGTAGASGAGAAGSAGSGGMTGASGTAGSGGVATTGDINADYCTPLATLICQRASMCGCASVYGDANLDTANCVSSYRDKCLGAYDPIVQQINLGNARVLKEAATACITAIAASTPGCERPNGAVAESVCDHWFSGDEPLGASCVFPLCASGQGSCVNGTCVALGEAGEACSNVPACAMGLACIGEVCTALRHAGQSCAADSVCAAGLHCVSGSCAVPKPARAACTSTDACAEGLSCQAGHCTAPAGGPCTTDSCGDMGTCVSPRTCIPKVGQGAPCPSADFCTAGFYCDDLTQTCLGLPGVSEDCVQSTLCDIDLACTTDNGICEALPGSGDDCGFNQAGPFACEDGLGCGSDNKCGALPGENMPCASGTLCSHADLNNDGMGNDLGCDFTANGSMCVLRKPVGGECQNDIVCAEGLFCDFGHTPAAVCTTIHAPDTSCKNGNECGPSGSCVPKNGGGFSCVALPSQGKSCLFDCTPGLVCAGAEATSFCLRDICNEL